MRQFLLGLSVSIAFVAGSVAAHYSQLLIPPAHANTRTAKWQYYCLSIDREDLGAFSAVLNRLGGEGWELVSFSAMRDVAKAPVCLKRAYEGAPPSTSTPAMQPGPVTSPSPPVGPSSK